MKKILAALTALTFVFAVSAVADEQNHPIEQSYSLAYDSLAAFYQPTYALNEIENERIIPVASVIVEAGEKQNGDPKSIIDGDTDTYFTAVKPTILFDLGTVQYISEVAVAFWPQSRIANMINFTLEISSDGDNYTDVYSGRNIDWTECYMKVDVGETARYIRIIGSRENPGFDLRLAELVPLGPGSSAPQPAEFNGEILLWGRILENGQNYVNIQDVAAMYGLYAAFDGRTITISDEAPAGTQEMRLCRDSNGIMCVPYTDALNSIELSGQGFKCNYMTGPRWEYGSAVTRVGESKILSRVLFFRHMQLDILNDAPAVLGDQNVDGYTDPSHHGACSYIPLEYYQKVLLARYMTPQYDSNEPNADVVYNGTHTIGVKNIDGRAYFRIRDLADIFGFSVDFDGRRVILSDERLPKYVLPERLKVYNIEGISYLKSPDAESYIAGLGNGLELTSGYYELTNSRPVAGNIVAINDGKMSVVELVSGNYVPHTGVSSFDRMYYLDFFVKKGLI
ncbi:MAG: discoidin domain-containing protein [Oscillospiraceae bacterium]|nr:discoidin domain-containing protein [Oscillospiraceae bacterium]